jgi:hypothetical protein
MMFSFRVVVDCAYPSEHAPAPQKILSDWAAWVISDAEHWAVNF